MKVGKKLTRRQMNDKLKTLVDGTISKLELKDGDVIVVREYETLDALSRLGPYWKGPKCPIICAPKGIEAIPLEELERVVNQLRVMRNFQVQEPLIVPAFSIPKGQLPPKQP